MSKKNSESNNKKQPGPARNIAKIPQELKDLFGFSAACSCGKVHSVELKGASIRPGAIDELVDWARQLGLGRTVCIVVDRKTRQLAGERVKKLLDKDGFKTSLCVVPDGKGNRPHADQAGLAYVEAALGGVDFAVAVGSGTLNDLTKLASFRKNIPYLVVATAPSMNGYTSAIAAVMLQGVKRTLDCHQPLAVIADLDIITRAPAELIAAGLGDLESKPTATADYRLSGAIRNDYYCAAPEQVVLQAEAKVAEAAADIGMRDPPAIALLTEALLLSGISMKLAGVSSPASGGEHLISHFWDMTAADEGRVEGWHGAQVGVATIVTATLYEQLGKLNPASINIDQLVAKSPGLDEIEARIKSRHAMRAEEVFKEYKKKHLEPEQLRRELGRIVDGWDDLWAEIGQSLRPGAKVRSILAAARAPVSVSQLGLSPGHLRRAFVAAREIRGRYTVLDLAADLQILDTAGEAVLQASGFLAEG
ncbi:MAG: sn-glycerol-1-phosphate dehydrogenase [Deltaproteobacteria bacterium]|nr:sn-glycerol-1-phosphate dehydrogenase [Deltaproteobacteria bacterium]